MFEKAKDYFQPPFRHDSGMIWGSGPNGERMLDVRGWGHLTGTGAHNLPTEQAEQIQDELGDHLAQLLNAHWPTSKPTAPVASTGARMSLKDQMEITGAMAFAQGVLETASVSYSTMAEHSKEACAEAHRRLQAALDLLNK